MNRGDKILIVDDDPDVRAILQELLDEECACEVVSASTAEEALAEATRGAPDIAVLDNSLPDMSGVELLLRLKENPSLEACRYVFLTASAAPGLAETLTKAGAVAVLEKSSDFSLLLAEIKKHIPTSPARAVSKTRAADVWWVFGRNGKQGPYSRNDILRMQAEMKLTGEEFVWREGMEHWKRLDEIEELKAERMATPCVLIVEDDDDFAGVLAEEIEQLGFDHVRAATAAEGWRLARAAQPALIILDLLLPDGSGAELFRKIQFDSALKNSPVFVISANLEPSRHLIQGAARILEKPVLRTQISAMLRSYLGGAPRRILVVDDDAFIRRLFESRLSQMGYEVVTAEDGERGIEALFRSRPDLVLLDLQMPVLDGFGFLEKLRASSEPAAPPVIIQTSMPLSDADVARLKDDGAALIFRKENLFKDDFIFAVRKLIPRLGDAAAASGEHEESAEVRRLRRDYKKSLDSYSEQFKKLALERASGSADATNGIKRLAHRIRGSAAMAGFPQLAALAGMLEEAEDSTFEASTEKLIIELERAAERNPPAQGCKLLIISGDASFTSGAVEALGSSDREIAVAESGSQAEKILKADSFALIVLDTILPDMDGRALLPRIKETSTLAAIPVIAVSAAGGETEAECYSHGAAVFFRKPVSLRALEAAIESRLKVAKEIRFGTDFDPLTGVLNRAGFKKELEKERLRAKRLKSPVAVAMVDIDHFKHVNDTYGHPVGDEVLVGLAKLLKENLRETDCVARFGGEEFIVLFPDTTADGAASVLNSILKKVRAMTFTSKQEDRFSITFSSGVARLADDAPAEDSIQEADRLLYLAKESGRNRVYAAEVEAPAPQSEKKRVLMVEDDTLISGLIEHRLKRENFEVVHRTNGHDGLEAALKDKFRLILLDVQLPGMDGFEILEKIRYDASKVKTPVIMLTSIGDEESIARAFDMGANDYITKPFSPTELVARIRKLVRT